MILLDTNVVSEPIKPHPDEAVERWIDGQLREGLYFSVTSITELKFGLEIMPAGKRRAQTERAVEDVISLFFGPRILQVTKPIAELQAELMASARTRGVILSFADAQIGAIAKANGFAIATRDVEAFEAMGLDVINPWNPEDT
jgi:toxin FitB